MNPLFFLLLYQSWVTWPPHLPQTSHYRGSRVKVPEEEGSGSAVSFPQCSWVCGKGGQPDTLGFSEKEGMGVARWLSGASACHTSLKTWGWSQHPRGKREFTAVSCPLMSVYMSCPMHAHTYHTHTDTTIIIINIYKEEKEHDCCIGNLQVLSF